MPFIVDRRESIQYDGTNGAEIAGTFLANTALVSDDGTTLVIDHTPFHGGPTDRYTLAVGDWVIRQPGGLFVGKVTDADYEFAYVELPPPPAP